MDNKKELYYYLSYIKTKKDGAGAIKIQLDFNRHRMIYNEEDIDGTVLKTIFIKGYDYGLAVDCFLEADIYRANWLSVEFF